jgi:hypothetical protein
MNADKRGLKMLVLSALIRVNLRPDSIFSQLLTAAVPFFDRAPGGNPAAVGSLARP